MADADHRHRSIRRSSTCPRSADHGDAGSSEIFLGETPDGNLAPQFVAVTNTDGDPDGLIRHGNERVLRARFNDARFFWNADQKKKLSERVHDLANVTFQAKLGSYLEKTERMEQLFSSCCSTRASRAARDGRRHPQAKVRYAFEPESDEFHAVAPAASRKPISPPNWSRSSPNCKASSADFTRARRASRKRSRSPSTTTTSRSAWKIRFRARRPVNCVSIADKLDTLRGCFRVGLIPAGSKDPFALRRAAQGIVKILVEGKLRLPVRRCSTATCELEEFLVDRIRYYFREIRGFKYDEVNAVLASGWDDLVGCRRAPGGRPRSSSDARTSSRWPPASSAFATFCRQAQFEGRATRCRSGAARAGPGSATSTTRSSASRVEIAADYRERAGAIASLRPKVDLFFDKVLVNAPDERVRQNRLTLLHTLLAEFSTIADFSEIVTNSSGEQL